MQALLSYGMIDFTLIDRVIIDFLWQINDVCHINLNVLNRPPKKTNKFLVLIF